MMEKSTLDNKTCTAKLPPSTLTAPKKPAFCLSKVKVSHSQLKLLCKILPSLVRWRLHVFYGQFFPGSSFHIRDRKLPRHLPVGSPEYSEYLSIREAQNILVPIPDYKLRTGLAEIYEAYLIEKEIYQRRSQRRFASRVFLPNLMLITKASERLDIPLRQVERALALYIKYRSGLPQSMQTTERRADTALDGITAAHMAASSDWQTLAEILYEDMRDVSAFLIFPSHKRNLRKRWGEMVRFRAALNRCHTAYFAAVKVESSSCKRKSHSLTRCGCQFPKRVFWELSPRQLAIGDGSYELMRRNLAQQIYYHDEEDLEQNGNVDDEEPEALDPEEDADGQEAEVLDLEEHVNDEESELNSPHSGYELAAEEQSSLYTEDDMDDDTDDDESDWSDTDEDMDDERPQLLDVRKEVQIVHSGLQELPIHVLHSGDVGVMPEIVEEV